MNANVTILSDVILPLLAEQNPEAYICLSYDLNELKFGYTTKNDILENKRGESDDW